MNDRDMIRSGAYTRYTFHGKGEVRRDLAGESLCQLDEVRNGWAG